MILKALIPFSCVVTGVSALWPLPSTYTHGNVVMWIDPHVQQTSYFSRANQFCLSSNLNSARVVETAVQRVHETIFNQSFVPWQFHPRNSDFEPALSSSAQFVSLISLNQTTADTAGLLKPLNGQIDESYTLDVTDNGRVFISAPTALGIAYGLTTFTQLFYAHSSCEYAYSTLAPVHVVDAPKFQHRGLNMDTSRVYYPVAVIERTIDALAYNKFNRLHLHITDAQSWPLVIPAMPELSTKGAYGPGMTYSPAQLEQIQNYGSLRGVEVYLEIDMPGHTSAVWFSYPELVSAFNVQPNWSNYSAEPPSGTLKLNSSAVYDFLDVLFKDILPRVRPYTAYFHTGGDEVNFNAYALDETVQSNDPEVLKPLLQKFIDTAHDHVRSAGLTPVVWEEMLLSYNLTLGPDVLVQTWQSVEAVVNTVKKGYKALAGNYEFWYLDCGHGQWIDFAQSASAAAFPYNDYCAPLHNWRIMYSYDPLENVPEDLEHLVVGGEISIWSEQTDPINFDRNVWPRACAAGEVLWSGAKDANGKNRSQIEASPRLAEMRERLVARGVMAEPIHMPFCTQNGTQCALY